MTDADVVRTLRSSGIADEALGDAWQEASQAVLLSTSANDSTNIDVVQDTMEWRDFIVLLDTCYRMSACDLQVFLERFQLPSPRMTNIRGKKNPFRAVSPMDSVLSNSPPDVTGKALSSSPKYRENGFDDTSRRPSAAVPPPIPPKAPRYLEDLQGDTHADGLKEYAAIHGSPIQSGLIAVGGPDTLQVYEPGLMPTVSRETSSEAFKSSLQLQAFVNRAHRTPFDDHAGFDAFEARSLATSQSSHDHAITISDHSMTSVLLPLPGSFEVDVPHCTPLARQIARNRLIGIDGRDSLSSSNKDGLKGSLKRLSLSLNKNFDEGRGEFSLSSLATGLEGAAREGSLSIIEAFFELGADPNYSTKGPKPIRHRALELGATEGHSAVVDYSSYSGLHFVSLRIVS